MDSWEPHLHWAFRQEHVLFPSLILHSSLDFVVAALLIVVICLLERLLTFTLDKRWAPRFIAESRWRKALWRICLYWTTTLLRLCYMLAAMTFQLGVIFVTATSLTLGQFLIECWASDEEPPRLRYDDEESRVSLIQPQRCYPLHSVSGSPRRYARSKPKPQDIFIHPSHSNIAHTDAAALQLGLGGDTEGKLETMSQEAGEAWQASEGQARAGELKGLPPKTSVELKTNEESFLIGGSNSDGESSES